MVDQQPQTTAQPGMLTRLAGHLRTTRTRLHTALTARETQLASIEALQAETARLRTQRGLDNEAFREDLVRFILDYNWIVRNDLNTLIVRLIPLGLDIPADVDLVTVQSYVCDLLAVAAIHISSLAPEPLNMIENLTRHLQTAPPKNTTAEAVAAHQIVHRLLSGEKTVLT